MAPSLQGPFYHGSITPLSPGLVLKGRGLAYHEEWCHLPHYEALHLTRPAHRLAHRDAVFMCASIDDVDSCGGGTDFVCLLQPLGPVHAHDMNWTGEIQCMLDDERLDLSSARVQEAVDAYWNARPSTSGEQVWEFLTPAARVLACHPYDDMEAERILKEQARLVLLP